MSIKFENVSYIYDRKTPFEKEAVSNISFEIKEDEPIAILGRTGSGKSTILQLMNGIIKPTIGMVEVDGIQTSDKASIVEVRKKIGLVFQYPEHQFFAENIYEEIAFGPRNFGMNETDIRKLIMDSIMIVGLRPDILSRSPFALSGGEQRKVAIASIISCDPKYLIFDEPTSSLDPVSAKKFFDMLKVFQSRGKSTVMVTHSVEEAITHFKKLLVISDGKIVFYGNSDGLLNEEALESWGLMPPPMMRVISKVKKECGNLYRLKEKIYSTDSDKFSDIVFRETKK